MSDPVSRLNAALEGRYRVERELGEGGMANVRHERKVALKVLKPELAAVVGAERFLSEIKTTANLKHPHILPLFDSGQADGFLFYVMPYVEGPSLRERIQRDKQLPVAEAVSIARKIAGALEHAHEHGVVHRDIKPPNVLFQGDEPVVTDFGIAIAVGAAGGARLTETGLSVGTPYYMSPEQATGDQGVGPASDIYSLACVLYEMLVGDPPYIGSTAQAVLGKIIQGTPVSATAVRSSVPPNVDAAIRKGLEKLPADRFTSARAFSAALGDPSFRHGVETAGAGRASTRASWLILAAVAVGALLVGAAGGALFAGGSGNVGDAGLVRYTIEPGEDTPLATNIGSRPDLAIDPSGRMIVYESPPGGLNVRPIDQLEAAPLRGSEGGVVPFFSPDAQWVGFVQGTPRGQAVLRVSILGGAPVRVAEVGTTSIYGASWSSDGQIYLGVEGRGIMRVADGGGEPEQLTTPVTADGETRHLWPSFVEGRDAVLFMIMLGGNANGAQLAALDLRTGEVERLGLEGTLPRYVATGHLVYAAVDGSIRAVPFDVERLEVTGGPVPLVEGVAVNGVTGAANFSISDSGRLVYVTGPGGVAVNEWQLVWVDREGKETLLPLPPREYREPRVSPDGRRLATSVVDDEGMDLWVYDVRSGAGLQLTENDAVSWVPIWSPDGSRIYFSSTLDAPQPESFTGTQWYGNVYSVPSDGSGPPVRMMTTEENQAIQDISPDGRTLIYTDVVDNATRWEIMTVPADGSGEPSPLVTGPSRRGTGSIAPNGRWIAYRSDESGRFEIYVQPYPGPGARVPVSIEGGSAPLWSADSRELFYRRGDNMIMAAEITGGVVPEVVGQTPLFSAQPYRRANGNRMYHLGPDGRFLMMRPPMTDDSGEPQPPRITVVLNWFEELRSRVPTGR